MSLNLTIWTPLLGRGRGGTTVIDVPVDELPDPDNPEHVDEPLPNDEPVCYVVTAYAESGPAPATPTNPGVRPGNGKNTVFWDAVPGASGYKVKKGYPPGQPPASGPSESEPTAEVCGTPNATPPETPTGFTATAGDEQVSLAWDSNAEAAGDFAFYALHFGTSADFTPGEGNRIGGDITGTSYLHTGRTNGVEYFYKLAAVDTAGNGSGYAADSATPADVTAPGVPGSFTATAAGSDQINLAWTGSTGGDVDGYEVDWSPNGVDTWTPVSGSPLAAGATSYSHTGLTGATAYFYRIRAFDEAENYSAYATDDAVTQSTWVFALMDISSLTYLYKLSLDNPAGGWTQVAQVTTGMRTLCSDDAAGLVFMAKATGGGAVEKITHAGTGLTTIRTGSFAYNMALACRPASGRVYFTESNVIRQMDYAGGNVSTLLSVLANSFFFDPVADRLTYKQAGTTPSGSQYDWWRIAGDGTDNVKIANSALANSSDGQSYADLGAGYNFWVSGTSWYRGNVADQTETQLVASGGNTVVGGDRQAQKVYHVDAGTTTQLRRHNYDWTGAETVGPVAPATIKALAFVRL